ncbi:MAG: prepilin-type N-terminal cleavage/methylation domain-containing protein [Dehalococcoidales bacterium]|nr:prepilin-type N-terminal cleavage/methylation domain-containing protein [Dehalococcoidales bacterium]
MRLFKLKTSRWRQAGFTLIEVLAAIAITGVIAMGVSIASAQVLNQTTKNNDYTIASRNALNALYWISHDATMAQSINGAEGFPQTDDLSIYWIGWDNTEHTANYTLENGVLKRIYSENGQVTVTVIASNINPDASLTNCVSFNGTLTVTITGSAGEGDRVINVTKVRDIATRPSL